MLGKFGGWIHGNGFAYSFIAGPNKSHKIHRLNKVEILRYVSIKLLVSHCSAIALKLTAMDPFS